MSKKAVSILLFALCVLPAWSWDFCQKNKDGVMLYYNFYDDDFQMCEVAYNKDAQYTGKFDTLWIPDVVILPAEYEGRDEDTVLAVVGIEPHTFEHAGFQHVHIPETVSEIGEYAFAFSGIKSLNLGEEWCFYIGGHAFMNCENLESVKIPKCVRTLSYGAFQGCTCLHDLVIEENENLAELPDFCFYQCFLRNWTLPSFIKKIGNDSFSYTGIKLINGINVLGARSLFSDISWDSIEIPETVTELGDYVFGKKPPKNLYINCKMPPYCRAITSLGSQFYDVEEKKYTWTIPPEYKIIIPIGTKDIYQTTWPWSRYDERCYIQRNTSGIETVEVDGNQDEESIFSLDGRQIDFKQKGVNIVRYKDGTAKKVLVR